MGLLFILEQDYTRGEVGGVEVVEQPVLPIIVIVGQPLLVGVYGAHRRFVAIDDPLPPEA